MKTSRSVVRIERGLAFSAAGEDRESEISVWDLGEDSKEFELHLGKAGSFIIDPARVSAALSMDSGGGLNSSNVQLSMVDR